jgi:hypothetical protein
MVGVDVSTGRVAVAVTTAVGEAASVGIGDAALFLSINCTANRPITPSSKTIIMARTTC